MEESIEWTYMEHGPECPKCGDRIDDPAGEWIECVDEKCPVRLRAKIIDEYEERLGMSWHYVIFKTKYVYGDTEDLVYDIREAYLDANGKVDMVSACSASPLGDTREDLLVSLAMMQLDALRHQEVTPADIPGYVYEENEVPL